MQDMSFLCHLGVHHLRFGLLPLSIQTSSKTYPVANEFYQVLACSCKTCGNTLFVFV